MRSVSLGAEPGDREIAAFADLVHRPLVIVGNGPSATFPPYRKLPGDAVVFRMNWFFLESHYHFGDQVDAWLFAVPNEKLEHSLAEEIRNRRYSVDRVLSPMQVSSRRDGDRWGNNFLGLGVEEYDHWAVISRHPRLARFFMSRPGLPTSGLQALGFALGVGFREIYLSGIDLYESADARYGHTITDEIAASLALKDVTPGYESAHSIDNDLAFLRASAVEFPDATLLNLTASVNIGMYLPDAPDVAGRASMTAENTPRLGEPKDRIAFELRGTGAIDPVLIKAPADTRLWAEVDGRRVAYATVVSGDYHHGARALANSLRRVTDVPLLALCTPDADRAALAASGLHVIDVPPILNPNPAGKMQGRFAATYTKLNVFRLDFLDRVVYLDSDTVVRKNIDDLFSTEGFAAVPDAGLRRPDGAVFNSGVFAAEPSFEVFEDLLARLADTPSYDSGDQGFLNEVFTDWTSLPLEYNTTKRIFSHHPALYVDDEIKVLHYVGVKPWEPAPAEDRYEELDLLWLDHLDGGEIRDLVQDLRRRAAQAAQDAQEAQRMLAQAEKDLAAQAARAAKAAARAARRQPDASTATPSQPSPLRRAQRFNAERAFSHAEAVLRLAWIDRQPSGAELRELAVALRGQGRHDEAVTHLQEAVRLNPTSRGIASELRAATQRASAAAGRPGVVRVPAVLRRRASQG